MMSPEANSGRLVNDGYRHISILVVHYVANSVFPKKINDMTIFPSQFKGYESLGPYEQISFQAYAFLTSLIYNIFYHIHNIFVILKNLNGFRAPGGI